MSNVQSAVITRWSKVMSKVYRYAFWFGLSKHRAKCKVCLVTVPMVWYLERSVLVSIPRIFSLFAEQKYGSGSTSTGSKSHHSKHQKAHPSTNFDKAPGCCDAWTKSPCGICLSDDFFNILHILYNIIIYSIILYMNTSFLDKSLRWNLRVISIIPAHSKNGCTFRSIFCFCMNVFCPAEGTSSPLSAWECVFSHFEVNLAMCATHVSPYWAHQQPQFVGQ